MKQDYQNHNRNSFYCYSKTRNFIFSNEQMKRHVPDSDSGNLREFYHDKDSSTA
jgi:hypothetical protein